LEKYLKFYKSIKKKKLIYFFIKKFIIIKIKNYQKINKKIEILKIFFKKKKKIIRKILKILQNYEILNYSFK
jgi:hypothetical protein